MTIFNRILICFRTQDHDILQWAFMFAILFDLCKLPESRDSWKIPNFDAPCETSHSWHISLHNNQGCFSLSSQCQLIRAIFMIDHLKFQDRSLQLEAR